MPRSKPTTVAPGIYRRAKCYEVRVFIAHGQPRLVEYFPLDTPLETMQRWQRDRRLERDQHRRPAPLDSRVIPNDARGTLDADLVRVLPQLEGRVSFKADRSHLRAALATLVPRDPARPLVTCRLGELPRRVVTTEHINFAIASWRRLPSARSVRTIQVAGYTRPMRDGEGVATLEGHTRKTPIASGQVVAVKTIRHRCRVLAELFHIIDGHTRVGRGPRARWFTATGMLAVTPVDAAKIPALEKPHPIDVDLATIRRVSTNLARATDPRTPARPPRDRAAWQQREAARQREAQHVYARFLVLVTTAQRPCQVGRAQPGDVALEALSWTVRAAKNEPAHTIGLNDDSVGAWRYFQAVEAWGEYDTSKHAKAVHAAGWPATVRPYNARHALAIDAIRRGVSLGDLQGMLGHMTPDTTRRSYAPFILERQLAVSAQLAGRLPIGPHAVASPEPAPAAPVAPTLSDRPADRPAAAPLALVPPAPAGRRRKAGPR